MGRETQRSSSNRPLVLRVSAISLPEIPRMLNRRLSPAIHGFRLKSAWLPRGSQQFLVGPIVFAQKRAFPMQVCTKMVTNWKL